MPIALADSIRNSALRLATLIGPVAIAGANFASLLVASRVMAAADFGSVSFLLAIIQFSFGMANALLITPMTGAHAAISDVGISTFGNVGAVTSLCVATLITCTSLALGGGFVASTFAGLAAYFQLIRWIGRGYHFSRLAALMHQGVSER